MRSVPTVAPHRTRPSVEQCRSVYLWQGDLSEFKERDTKKWTEYHDVDTEPGLFCCAIYDRRPYLCRIYAGITPDGPQAGCGFNRER
jgi:hypothetical protein